MYLSGKNMCIIAILVSQKIENPTRKHSDPGGMLIAISASGSEDFTTAPLPLPRDCWYSLAIMILRHVKSPPCPSVQIAFFVQSLHSGQFKRLLSADYLSRTILVLARVIIASRDLATIRLERISKWIESAVTPAVAIYTIVAVII